MSRFDGWAKPDVPGPESPRYVADFAEMQARRVDMDQLLEDWAAGLDPAWLEGPLTWWVTYHPPADFLLRLPLNQRTSPTSG